jgi:hypothetical protein
MFLIFDLNGNKIGSYSGDLDETSNTRSYLLCPPHAQHFELPYGLNEDTVKLELVEVQTEQRILLREEILAQDEVLAQDAIIEDGVEIAPAIAHQDAVLAHDAVYSTIPAIKEMMLVEDVLKSLSIRQAKANSNLEEIRMLREPLLIATDREINIAEDNELDVSVLRAYRIALRSCTDSLKESNGDAKLTVESIIPTEFNFPIKG